MRSTESFSIHNASASGDPVQISGGVYSFMAIATWGGGTVSVSMLGPDGSTWMAHISRTTDGVNIVDLPPGQCKFVVATATGVYASLTRVPFE